MVQNQDKYISFSSVKTILNILAFICLFALIFMHYDAEFKWVILLPVTFIFLINIFSGLKIINGIGCIFLIGMYCFRMCLLPVLCAYGDFYIEPSRDIYIENFWIAITLMCIECTIVFCALAYYSAKYYLIFKTKKIKGNYRHNDSVIVFFALICLIAYITVLISHPGFLKCHYHFLIGTLNDEQSFEQNHIQLQNLGAVYYLMVIIDLVGRPIISFVIVKWALDKKTKSGILFACIIGLLNVLIISDRRILSFLVGICCFLQILLELKSGYVKRLIYILIVVLGVITIFYCFIGEDTPIRVARKFQRYFSGPSLTAIGCTVFEKYLQTPVEFIKLLFNDSILCTGLFGTIKTVDYVELLCGSSGRGIWTPMFIGAIQYFHFLAPILICIIVKYITYTDYVSQIEESTIQKMMMNYLTISVSIYMVMYSIELICYNIIFIGGVYYLLRYFNRRLMISLKSDND